MFLRGWPLAVALAGCGSFGEASSSTDAGSPPTDASSPTDATADHASDPDGGGALPCPPNALFCDAFDARAGLQGNWDGTTIDGATLALDAMLFRSPPGSLRATATSAARQGDAHLEKALTNVPQSVHVRFAVRFESLIGVDYARIFAGTADSRDFEIAVGATNFQIHTVDTAGNLNYKALGTAPTAGVWQRIHYTLLFTQNGSVTIDLDGVTIYTKPLSLGTDKPPANLTVRLGVTSQNAIDVHYDDFSITPD